MDKEHPVQLFAYFWIEVSVGSIFVSATLAGFFGLSYLEVFLLGLTIKFLRDKFLPVETLTEFFCQ